MACSRINNSIKSFRVFIEKKRKNSISNYHDALLIPIASPNYITHHKRYEDVKGKNLTGVPSVGSSGCPGGGSIALAGGVGESRN